MKQILVFLSMMLICGCASFKPPVVQQSKFCSLNPFNLDVSTENIAPVLERPLQNSEPLLYLSGGSQNGAFGAGYLKGWKESGTLPNDFAVVTGVSTGALQSVYAFTGEAHALADEYTVDNEGEILKPYVSGGSLGIFDYLTVLRKGSVGDLGPLKAKIEGNLKKNNYQLVQLMNQKYVDDVEQNAYLDDLSTDLNENNIPKRVLLVVATSIDDGKAKAFDMTRLANRIDRHRMANEIEKAEHLVGCFADVLLASSSVPLAAQPTFIDNEMYIDGGVKFTVTNHRVSSTFPLFDIPKKDVFVIINGKAEMSVDCDICGIDTETGGHKPWSFIDLTGRTIGLLTNQVKQFSINKINAELEAENSLAKRYNLCEKYSELTNGRDDPFFIENCADINPDTLFTSYNKAKSVQIEVAHLAQPEWGLGGKSCMDYLKEDKETLDPVEFHPNYMTCLIEYGTKRALAGR